MANWTRRADDQMDLIPDTGKMLIELAKQYKGDVEGRLSELEGEKSALPDDPDVTQDLADQIAHWEATLSQIESVLRKVGNA